MLVNVIVLIIKRYTDNFNISFVVKVSFFKNIKNNSNIVNKKGYNLKNEIY